ncbi:MAG: tRNA uridine-5-carboxymethylaminomethyl(34) synthesis GTPase MnmE [Verrucomicrobia subdivision 3 bacterium]|nr:tRNA uridine-5-carboxymethylaminomethyl(34) synthesis GTPase MnmE [Limisphaerales bacterium]
MLDDTIAAIATPLGEGGLAVIRLSGARAFQIVDQCFRPRGSHSQSAQTAPSHTLHYGHIVRNSAAPSTLQLFNSSTDHPTVIDEVLVAVMRGPRTFTREDVVEITCHGGLLPAKAVLDTVLASGARLALPGEFTKRAFLNGRIDLAQAEAVADVIHSRTELALAAANEQLAGKLSQRINKLRDDLLATLAHVEAHIDFPDEDIAPDTKDKLAARLESGIALMEELLRTADEGQLLRRGIRAAIVGPPNAGKSSLLNQLLGRDRAIVSAIPGTTRDTIEETANVRGIPVVFVDTAGLREARDEIEIEGIKRSHQSLAQAELVLLVLDASEAFTPADEQFLSTVRGRKCIIVRNKIDLPARLTLPLAENIQVVDVSCLTGAGIERLKDTIKDLVWSGEVTAGMFQVMINSRHQEALRRARAAAADALHGLRADQTFELVAIDLRLSLNAVGEVVGKTTTEDLLDSIFSQFCIGK